MFELLLGHSSWAYRSGELAFARGWPLWLYIVLLLAAVLLIAASLWRYRHLTPLRLGCLGVLQLLFYGLLLALLWRPVLNVERIRERENVVAVLVDNSGSMQAGETPSRLAQATQALDAGVLTSLARSSIVRLFSFSDHADPVESLAQLGAGSAQTRIGDSLRSVLQMASSTPLAAVVLVTDGAENGGSLSEAAISELTAFGVPIHTVGVGPEQLSNDLELSQLNVAAVATAGETLKAEVSIRHQQQASTRLRIYDGGNLLAAEEIKLSSATGVTTRSIEFPAGTAGLRDLRFTLDTAVGETNTVNNSRRQVIDVTGRRRAVLYIEGEPRWEYKFIRRAAETDSSLRLASLVRATPNRYYRQGVANADELPDGFPKDPADLFAFDAVVIGSLEAAALNPAQHQSLKDFVDRRGGSLLMLAGRDGLGDGGWGRVAVASLLPAQLSGSGTHTYGSKVSRARLTVYGAESPLGRLDTDARRNAELWEGLPPLADLQTLGPLRPGAVVLLDALAGEASYPLLVTQRYGRGASYLLATASTWRWAMRLPHDDPRHKLFWRQLLHTLAAAAPARASLSTDRKVYDDATQVPIEAEIFDEQFRPVSDAVVQVHAVAEDGTVVEQRLLPTSTNTGGGHEDGRYSAVLALPATGLYRVDMTAMAGKKEVGSDTLHLRRDDGVLENFETQQHRALLERLAQQTGGRYWQPAALADLPDAIRYSKAGMLERQTL
ncbi:MAG: vWA domain-containing protein, partial [Pseudomonadota bacterium]